MDYPRTAGRSGRAFFISLVKSSSLMRVAENSSTTPTGFSPAISGTWRSVNLRQVFQDGQIENDRFSRYPDAGPSPPPSCRLCNTAGMHWAIEALPHRFVVEAGEKVIHRAPEFFQNNAARFAWRKRAARRTVACKVRCNIRRSPSPAGADDLAKLDESRVRVPQGPGACARAKVWKAALLMNGNGGVLHTEQALEGDEFQNIGKAIFPQRYRQFPDTAADGKRTPPRS